MCGWVLELVFDLMFGDAPKSQKSCKPGKGELCGCWALGISTTPGWAVGTCGTRQAATSFLRHCGY
jgi:hypothetical protein